MIGEVFRTECRVLVRDRRALWMLGVATAIALLVQWSGSMAHRASERVRAAATARVEHAWDHQGASNPHSAAHFGHFLFRPDPPLARLDHGVTTFTGRLLRLEAHRQNAPIESDVTRAGQLTRFGRLDGATVLQILVPLLLVLVGYASVAGERDSGRLRMLLVQGADPHGLLHGKALALAVIGLIPLAAMVACELVTCELVTGDGSQGPADGAVDDRLLRLGTFSVTHGLLAVGWSYAVVVISAGAATSSAALSRGLVAWIVMAVLAPRLVDDALRVFQPLPSRERFESAMKADREEAIDGHDPRDVRRRELEAAFLKEHGVATIEELPLNFDGIVMQADEEAGNAVWDDHYGRLRDRMRQQLASRALAGVLFPHLAVSAVSMSSAGTDLNHHLDFLEQAEGWRRRLVQDLNEELAFGGSRTGNWEWKVEAGYFSEIPDFVHRPLAATSALGSRGIEAATLLGWALLLLALHGRAARRLATVGGR